MPTLAQRRHVFFFSLVLASRAPIRHSHEMASFLSADGKSPVPLALVGVGDTPHRLTSCVLASQDFCLQVGEVRVGCGGEMR
jgi:hypothetical protein